MIQMKINPVRDEKIGNKEINRIHQLKCSKPFFPATPRINGIKHENSNSSHTGAERMAQKRVKEMSLGEKNTSLA